MTLVDTDTTATIWFESGIPVRMMWRGRRWRVTDTPTEPDWFYWSTHPPRVAAWRFQATDTSGDSLVVDVVESGQGWSVVKTYR